MLNRMLPKSVTMTFKTRVMDFDIYKEELTQVRLKNAKNTCQYADPVEVV